MDPQRLDGGELTEKSNIWSLGIILYEMLYGKRPWNDICTVKIINQMKTHPVQFPVSPQRSQKVKDLITRMLQIKEQDRISWLEIFDHDLINENYSHLYKQIKEIILNNSDNFEKLSQLNILYVDRNKVVVSSELNISIQKCFVQHKLTQDQIKEQQQIQKNLDLNQTQDQQLSIPRIIEIQNKQIARSQLTQKIDQFLKLKRNTSLFIQFTSNSLLGLFNNGEIKFPSHLFYRIFFLLQKHSKIILQELIGIVHNKISIESGITKNKWSNYLNSKEYFTTRQVIENDTNFFEPYFEQIQIRTQDILTNLEENISPKDHQDVLKEFVLLIQINDFLIDLTYKLEDSFQILYEKTLKKGLQLFVYLLETEKSFENNRFILQTIKFLKICVDPQQYFKWEQYFCNADAENNYEVIEFSKFYEDYENISNQNLLIELKEDFKQCLG